MTSWPRASRPASHPMKWPRFVGFWSAEMVGGGKMEQLDDYAKKAGADWDFAISVLVSDIVK